MYYESFNDKGNRPLKRVWRDRTRLIVLMVDINDGGRLNQSRFQLHPFLRAWELRDACLLVLANLANIQDSNDNSWQPSMMEPNMSFQAPRRFEMMRGGGIGGFPLRIGGG